MWPVWKRSQSKNTSCFRWELILERNIMSVIIVEILWHKFLPNSAQENTHWGETLWLQWLEKPLLQALTFKFTRKYTLERISTNAMTVRKFLVDSHPLKYLWEFILERNLFNVRNVGKPSVFLLPLGDLWELTLEKKSYECIRWGKAFSWSSSLQEKPYKCYECGIDLFIVLRWTPSHYFRLYHPK